MASAASEADASSDNAALLSEFPPVEFAFAYGSAVFRQLGYDDLQQRDAMTDLVFAVPDARSWHAENMERNRAHYSTVASAMGPGGVASVQEGFGAGIYYNALVRIQGRLVKYGVISSASHRLTLFSQTALPRFELRREDVIRLPLPLELGRAARTHLPPYVAARTLLGDLHGWTTLYVSGRMQKPVQLLRSGAPEVERAAARNLRSALLTALLLQPSRFGEKALFHALCGLSYLGDERLRWVENSKVENIVAAQLPQLRRLYATALAESPLGEQVSPLFELPCDLESRSALSQQLPRNAKVRLECLKREHKEKTQRERKRRQLPRNAKVRLECPKRARKESDKESARRERKRRQLLRRCRL